MNYQRRKPSRRRGHRQATPQQPPVRPGRRRGRRRHAAGATGRCTRSHFVSTDNAYTAVEVAQITPSVGGTVADVKVKDTQP